MEKTAPLTVKLQQRTSVVFLTNNVVGLDFKGTIRGYTTHSLSVHGKITGKIFVFPWHYSYLCSQNPMCQYFKVRFLYLPQRYTIKLRITNINQYFIWKKSKNLHPHKTHSH